MVRQPSYKRNQANRITWRTKFHTKHKKKHINAVKNYFVQIYGNERNAQRNINNAQGNNNAEITVELIDDEYIPDDPGGCEVHIPNEPGGSENCMAERHSEEITGVDIDPYHLIDLSSENAVQNVVKFYRNATISRDDAMKLIECFRSRHKLSDAAFQDLLSLIKKALLPPDNNLPSTAKYFNKLMQIDSSLEIYEQGTNYTIFHIGKQIEEIIKRNFTEMIKYKIFLRNEKNFDLCGEIYRSGDFNTINLSLFTDGGELSKSANMPVWPIIASVRDLPPTLEKSVRNAIWLGISVPTTNEPLNWQSLFKPIIQQIDSINLNGGFTFKINDRVISRKFKVQFIEFLADAMARKSLLSQVGPVGYYACPVCLTKGEHDGKKVIYPHHPRFDLRSTWVHLKDKGLCVKDSVETPLTKLMKLPQAIGNDTMHTTYSGIFKLLFQDLYSTSSNKIYFDTLKWQFFKPLEIKRTIRPFSQNVHFKANEWRPITLYLAVVLFQDIRHVGNAYWRYENGKKIANILLLCSAMNLFSSKNLTREKIAYAQKLLNRWHFTLATSFGRHFLRFISHMHLHYGHLSLAHGSVATRTCFYGESLVGFVGKIVHCPQFALKQITERLIKWRSMASVFETGEKFEEVINTIKETEHGLNFARGKFTKIPLEDYNFADAHLIWNRFPRAQIDVLGCAKLNHFIIHPMHSSNGQKDSVVFIESIIDANGEPFIPALVELIICVNKVIYFLVNVLDTAMPVCSTMNWIEDATTRKFLTDKRFNFPSAYLVKESEKDYQFIESSKIQAKGFIIYHKDIYYVFPMNSFDHD